MSDAAVRGIIHVIEDTKTYGQSGFRKRVVVLEQDKGRFTNYIPVEFVHEGCDDVDELSVGDDVEITYRLTGRKWQKDEQSEVKYFLNAEAMNFKVMQKADGGTATPAASSEDAPSEEGEEEIPF